MIPPGKDWNEESLSSAYDGPPLPPAPGPPGPPLPPIPPFPPLPMETTAIERETHPARATRLTYVGVGDWSKGSS